MMEIEDESDFAVPLVPPDPRTSTPRAINNNAQCNLPAQLDASPVQAVVQGGGDQVQPEAEQACCVLKRFKIKGNKSVLLTLRKISPLYTGKHLIDLQEASYI